jgi:hypothetical protein
MATSPLIRNPWSPTTINGWWPQVSPDGLYVAYGNGTVYIADLATGTEHYVGTGRPMGWYGATTLYILEELDPNDSVNTTQLFSVEVGTWTKVNLGISYAHAAANSYAAVSGHWGTWLTTGLRIVYDDVVIRAGDAYGLAMAGDYLITHRMSDWTIQVYKNGVFQRSIAQLDEDYFFAVSESGWVAYQGVKGIYVSPPTGPQHRISAAVEGQWQNLGPLVEKNGKTWVFSGGGPGNNAAVSYVWGRNAAMTDPASQITVSSLGPLWLSIVSIDSGWVIGGTSDTGTLYVHWTVGGGSSSIPTDLGLNDVGFLLFVADYNHLLRWNGMAWEFAPGDNGNGYVVQAAALPAPYGWVLSSGAQTTKLTLGTRVTATRVTTPALTTVTATTALKWYYRR